MHSCTFKIYKKLYLECRGVLPHLPPNSHAENLRQIFILRPVSSLIQSKWMQQQTNLSNPTSKQPCSLSPCDLGRHRHSRREKWGRRRRSGSERKGRNFGQYWMYDPTCWLEKNPQQRSPLAPVLENCKLYFTMESKLLLPGSHPIHWNIPLSWGEAVNVKGQKMNGSHYTLTLQQRKKGSTVP